jgi:amino acid transporter
MNDSRPSSDASDNRPSHARATLRRVVSFKSYVSIGLGAMIGMGWVVYTGQWLESGGPLGAVLGFAVGGLLLIPVGQVYAELTPAIPVAGGEMAFTYKAFGPAPAFLAAWLLAFGYIIICPFETAAIGLLLKHIAPSWQTTALYEVSGFPVSASTILPGLLIGVLVTVLNYLGVKSSARFQMIATAAMLLCVVLFTAVALIKGDPRHLEPLFADAGASWLAAGAALLSVVVVVPFWMSGFDAIPQAAEESDARVEPRRLGTAVIVSMVMGVGFYVAVILAVAVSMPWQEAVALEMPTSQVFEAAFGYSWAAKLVLIAALLGLATSLNGFFLAATRVVFSAGRGGLLPRWFGAVHGRFGTPKNAVLFVGLLSLVGAFLGKPALGPIVHAGSFAFVSVWFVACLAAIRLRRTAPDLDRPYRVKRRATLWLGAGVSLALALFFVVPGSPEVLVWPHEVLIVVGWLALGTAFHLWRRRRNDMSAAERDLQILGDYR